MQLGVKLKHSKGAVRADCTKQTKRSHNENKDTRLNIFYKTNCMEK